MWTPSSIYLMALLGLLVLLLVKESESLECYYCRGNSYYDPNHCFNPNYERTFIQECRTKTEVCEKKLVRIDGWTQIVERGCSANCNGRDFIWTEDFKVYCCNGNQCNAGTRVPTSATLIFSLSAFVLSVHWLKSRLL